MCGFVFINLWTHHAPGPHAIFMYPTFFVCFDIGSNLQSLDQIRPLELLRSESLDHHGEAQSIVHKVWRSKRSESPRVQWNKRSSPGDDNPRCPGSHSQSVDTFFRQDTEVSRQHAGLHARPPGRFAPWAHAPCGRVLAHVMR